MARKEGVQTIDGLGSLTSVSFDGTNFFELLGASNVGHDAGEAPSSQVKGFRLKSTSIGKPDIQPITYDLAAWNPNPYVVARLRAAWRSGSTVTWRHDYFGEMIRDDVAGETFATEAASAAPATPFGDVTVVGAPAMAFVAGSVEPGMALVYAGGLGADGLVASADDVKIVEVVEISDADGSLTKLYVSDVGSRRATAVAAATAEIWRTGTRYQGQVRVTQFGSFQAGSDADTHLQSGVQYLPTVELPDPVAFFGTGPTSL